MKDEPAEVAIPLVEERLHTAKREVETGRVKVRTLVDEHETIVRDELVRGRVDVQRVAVNVEVAVAPPVREEGDTIVIPVVQEVLVVEKKLMLIEELRVSRSTYIEEFAQPVTVRSQRAVVEREEMGGDTANPRRSE